MSRKVVLISVAALLAAAGAAVAIAQVGDRDGRPGADRMQHGGDHHGRGMGHRGNGDDRGFGREGRRGFGRGDRRAMTADEFDARARERFARLDKNSDGVIDAAEIEASIADRAGRGGERMQARVQRMLTRLGADKDGKVTRDKFLEKIKQRFARMDLNSDGKITDDDLPPMMRGRDVLKGEGGAMGRGGSGRGGMFSRLIGADANKDGVITLEEVVASASKRFDQMDRNKDGVIDQADFDAMRKDMTAYRVQRFLHRYGAAKSGKVTREQYFAAAKERFAARDVNSDGRIDRADRGGGRGWGRGHGGRGDGQRGPGGPGAPDGAPGGGPGGPGGPGQPPR